MGPCCSAAEVQRDKSGTGQNSEECFVRVNIEERKQEYVPPPAVSNYSSHLLLLESGTGGGIGSGGTASSRRKDGRGTKRGRDEDDTNRRPDMKLNVPEILKVLLVDDWEAVTKNNQVRSFADIKSYMHLSGVLS